MRISDWSSDVCSSDLWSSRSRYYGGGYPGGAYSGGSYQSYGYGWYSPGVVVTTIINGPPVITEHVETSTRTYYETVPVRKRHVAKKKWKPKPKPKVRRACCNPGSAGRQARRPTGWRDLVAPRPAQPPPRSTRPDTSAAYSPTPYTLPRKG